jgi:hypothetical protein
MRPSLLALALPALFTLLAACKEGAKGADAGASATSADKDVGAPVEVTSPRPRYALASITDKQVERLVTRAGWTPTVVGKTPPAEGSSTIRVAALRKADGAEMNAVVFVRCRKPNEKAAAYQPGEAYFRDGSCDMTVAARVGIRNKTAESKELLEALLAGSAD